MQFHNCLEDDGYTLQPSGDGASLVRIERDNAPRFDASAAVAAVAAYEIAGRYREAKLALDATYRALRQSGIDRETARQLAKATLSGRRYSELMGHDSAWRLLNGLRD
jgi:hypothetical protein